MSDREKKEQEILSQELSLDEMETIAGGEKCVLHLGRKQSCSSELNIKYGRQLRKPDGTMNCSATVEDGSYCGSNDACYEDETVYFGMHTCHKAWQ